MEHNSVTTTPASEELKPCPCCRNAAKIHSKSPDYFSGKDWTKSKHKIKCTVCPITTGWLSDREKLIIGWNTRTSPQSAKDGEKQAALEALKRLSAAVVWESLQEQESLTQDAVHVGDFIRSEQSTASPIQRVSGAAGICINSDALRVAKAMTQRENAALTAKPDENPIALKRPLPDHDNHHNALLCPYCNPDGLVLAPKPDAVLDVEALKRECFAFYDKKHNYPRDKLLNWGNGWDDCIDHLYSSGRLSSKAEE